MNLSFLVAPETIPPIVVDRRNPDQKKHSTIITICFQNLEGNVKKITNQQHNRQRLQNHNKPTTQKNLKKVCKKY